MPRPARPARSRAHHPPAPGAESTRERTVPPPSRSGPPRSAAPTYRPATHTAATPPGGALPRTSGPSHPSSTAPRADGAHTARQAPTLAARVPASATAGGPCGEPSGSPSCGCLSGAPSMWPCGVARSFQPCEHPRPHLGHPKGPRGRAPDLTGALEQSPLVMGLRRRHLCSVTHPGTGRMCARRGSVPRPSCRRESCAQPRTAAGCGSP